MGEIKIKMRALLQVPFANRVEPLIENDKDQYINLIVKDGLQYVARSHRILLLVGDDYNDFTYLGNVTPEERRSKSAAQSKYWGRKWIILSNPNYGHWERALYDYDSSLSREAVLEKKHQFLRPE